MVRFYGEEGLLFDTFVSHFWAFKEDKLKEGPCYLQNFKN